jgi:hypothetical protein
MWMARAGAPFVTACVLIAISIKLDKAPPSAKLAIAKPGPAPARITRALSSPPRCERASLVELHGDVRKLAELWQQRHPCDPIPRCDGEPARDRIVTLRADLDDTPGNERVIASARFGIAMYDARGNLLATADLTCDGWHDVDDLFAGGPPRLRLAARHLLDTDHAQLEVHTRAFAHCGESMTRTAFARRDDHLIELVELDDGGQRGCGMSEWTTRIRFSVQHPGMIEWRSSERSRRLTDSDGLVYGPWTVTDTACTLIANADGRFARASGSGDCRQSWEP